MCSEDKNGSHSKVPNQGSDGKYTRLILFMSTIGLGITVVSYGNGSSCQSHGQFLSFYVECIKETNAFMYGANIRPTYIHKYTQRSSIYIKSHTYTHLRPCTDMSMDL